MQIIDTYCTTCTSSKSVDRPLYQNKSFVALVPISVQSQVCKQLSCGYNLFRYYRESDGVNIVIFTSQFPAI